MDVGGLPKARHRFRETAESIVSHSQVVVGIGKLRIPIDGVLKCAGGGGVIAASQKAQTQAEVQLRRPRVDGPGLFENCARVVVFAVDRFGDAEIDHGGKEAAAV